MNAPILPRWTAEERGLWLDLLEAYTTALLPTEEEMLRERPREEKALEAVRLGARLADLAIQELQFRTYAQSEENSEQPGAELNFQHFSEWLERTRPRRKNRPTVTARRKR